MAPECLVRALGSRHIQMARSGEGWELSRIEKQSAKGLLGFGKRSVKRTVILHSFPDPADGLVSLAALRTLKEACGLPSEESLGDAEGRRDSLLRLHRTLWPRLLGLWS